MARGRRVGPAVPGAGDHLPHAACPRAADSGLVETQPRVVVLCLQDADDIARANVEEVGYLLHRDGEVTACVLGHRLDRGEEGSAVLGGERRGVARVGQGGREGERGADHRGEAAAALNEGGVKAAPALDRAQIVARRSGGTVEHRHHAATHADQQRSPRVQRVAREVVVLHQARDGGVVALRQHVQRVVRPYLVHDQRVDWLGRALETERGSGRGGHRRRSDCFRLAFEHRHGGQAQRLPGVHPAFGVGDIVQLGQPLSGHVERARDLLQAHPPREERGVLRALARPALHRQLDDLPVRDTLRVGDARVGREQLLQGEAEALRDQR